MNPDVELLLREGLDRLTADARTPAGMAGRVLARRRRRRAAACTAVAATAAVTAVTAVTVAAAAGGTAGPAATTPVRATASPAATGPVLTTAYVVGRVENALAGDGQVMRQTISVSPSSAGASYLDGQPSYENVTWAYQNRNSTQTFGANGQLQATVGTGIVNGKLQGVQVDYIRHQWELQPGFLSMAPASGCTAGGLGEAIINPDTNWPLLIKQNLACGGYKIVGYAQIDGTRTVKITGSRVTDAGPAGDIRTTNTLFVSPSTYLPVRITESLTAPHVHASPISADIQWLPPTAANRANASVTIPCGYQQISSPSGKPVTGQPSSACR